MAIEANKEPRQAKPLIWIGGGIVGLFLFSLVVYEGMTIASTGRLEQELSAAKASEIPLSQSQLFVSYMDVPDSMNAAPKYEKLLANFKPIQRAPTPRIAAGLDTVLPGINVNPPPQPSHEEREQIDRTFTPLVGSLRELSSMPFCRFKDLPALDFADDHPMSTKLSQCIRILSDRIDRLVKQVSSERERNAKKPISQQGRSAEEKKIEKFISNVQLQAALMGHYQQAFPFDVWRHMGMQQRTFGSLTAALDSKLITTPEQAIQILLAIQKIGPQPSLVRMNEARLIEELDTLAILRQNDATKLPKWERDSIPSTAKLKFVVDGWEANALEATRLYIADLRKHETNPDWVLEAAQRSDARIDGEGSPAFTSPGAADGALRLKELAESRDKMLNRLSALANSGPARYKVASSLAVARRKLRA